MSADLNRPLKQRNDSLCSRAGCDVKVLWSQTKQKIAHAATGEECLMACVT